MAHRPGSAEARAWSHSVRERKGMEIVARLGPDNGFLSWRSSPHVMWLADQLYHVCWL